MWVFLKCKSGNIQEILILRLGMNPGTAFNALLVTVFRKRSKNVKMDRVLEN